MIWIRRFFQILPDTKTSLLQIKHEKMLIDSGTFINNLNKLYKLYYLMIFYWRNRQFLFL
jgi:hypothetical protein